MKNVRKQYLELLHFFCSLHFKRVSGTTIKVVEEQFQLYDLPETVREYIRTYLEEQEK